MTSLPDELWRQILEIGIKSSKLNFKDVCCVSITCRRLHRLSDEDSLWSYLLSSDFPPPPPPQQNPSSSSSSAKSTYKLRFEKERERKAAAHRRAVLRKESEVLERERKIRELEALLIQETERLRASFTQLSNFHQARQASVALNVWQPEIVRGRQKQIVEQCPVPIESRIHSLEMEHRLCRKQIDGLNKAFKDEKSRLQEAKQELASLKYHPLRHYRLTGSEDKESSRKRKKIKQSIDCSEKHAKTK